MNIRSAALLVGGLAVLSFSQAHLDPASYPSFGTPGWCDTAGKKAAYEDIWRGITPYSVGLGVPVGTCDPPGCPMRYFAPVIDGYLEDSLWYNAETLLINSWEVSGYDECCNTANPNFYGARDLHAIWRFFYTHDGLFIGCEVYDDIHDVDSLKAWYAQDGIEIGIDPWDWGDYGKGYWTSDPGLFRRYYYPPNIICDPGPCMTWEPTDHFLHIQKRLNEEPYLTGLIHEKLLTNYVRGDEVTNFVLGRADAYGIQWQINYQGVDPWFREIHHVEFKFPFHNALWPALDTLGFYDATGLPRAGNMFKMMLSNNDDDIPGPDGANPNYNTSSIWRVDPFFMEEPSGHDHWSDMKYYPVFKYVARTISRVHVSPTYPAVERGQVVEAKNLEVTNSPNPLNTSTIFYFTIPGKTSKDDYRLAIYDIRGRLVRTLIKGKNDRFGVRKQVVWNGMDNGGKRTGTGVYYYQLKCGSLLKVGKLAIVK